MRYLALVAFLSLAACPPAGPGPGPVQIAEICATRATHDVALNILGDVQGALAATSANWEAKVTALVVRWGIDAVKCAVAEVTSQATVKAAGSNDPVLLTVAARGRRWLAEH